jgi:hypothetical protein
MGELMSRNGNKQRCDVILDQPTIARLEAISDRAGLSRSAAIRVAVAEYHRATISTAETKPI